MERHALDLQPYQESKPPSLRRSKHREVSPKPFLPRPQSPVPSPSSLRPERPRLQPLLRPNQSPALGSRRPGSASHSAPRARFPRTAPVNLSSGPPPSLRLRLRLGRPRPFSHSCRAGNSSCFPFWPRPHSGSCPFKPLPWGHPQNCLTITTGDRQRYFLAFYSPSPGTKPYVPFRKILMGTGPVPSPRTKAGFPEPARKLDASGLSPGWPRGGPRERRAL